MSKETQKETTENIRLNESEKGLTFNPKLAEIKNEFWYIKNEKIKIDNEKFIDFLQNNGFHKYSFDSNRGIELVHEDKGIAIRVKSKHIKQFVIKYLEENNYLLVKEHLSGLKYLFQMPFLEALSPLDIDEVTYTMSEVFTPGKIVILRRLKSNPYMGGTGHNIFPGYYAHIHQDPFNSEMCDITNIVPIDGVSSDFDIDFSNIFNRLQMIPTDNIDCDE